MEEQKSARDYVLDKLLEKAEKRGVNYKYKLHKNDISKMPRFRGSKLKYNVVNESYKTWRSSLKDKTLSKGIFKKEYSKIWTKIADCLFQELENNFQGVKLGEQTGDMYIGVPPNIEHYILSNKPNHKHIVWRNKIKYCNVNFRYYFFTTYHRRYRSAVLRDDFYKSAKEKMHIFHNVKNF